MIQVVVWLFAQALANCLLARRFKTPSSFGLFPFVKCLAPWISHHPSVFGLLVGSSDPVASGSEFNAFWLGT
jgi:hypothetical protein